MLSELTSERFVYNEIQPSDGEELHAYQSLPEQLFFMAVDKAEYDDGVLRVERYIEHKGSRDDQRMFAFAVRQKTDNRLVGEVSLSKIEIAQASLGFSVAPDFWGRGYASEMASRIIEYGFKDLKLHRIFANIAIENKASKRVAEKIGMSYEGTARESKWAQERWWSEAVYAVLDDEFELNSD